MNFSLTPSSFVDYPAVMDITVGATDMGMLWRHLREAWLNLSYERSYSHHTRTAYATASAAWIEFLAACGVQPWQCSTVHVRAWQEHLRSKGNGPATINARLAAVSSYYEFVRREVHLIEGVERTAFSDASGHTRANPFRVGNLRRAKVERYGKARPLRPEDVGRLFDHLEERKDTLLGSRNRALLTTYFLTAARNSEVVQMRWGDIRPSRAQTGSYIYAWHGKGNKREDSPLPGRAYTAIRHHLEVAGRWEPEPTAHIWTPLVTHGVTNLSSARHGKAGSGYISQKNAVRILHTALRTAGVKDADSYRIHDLRHTFAHLFRGNLETLRQILHHESIKTTGIYVHSLADPVDDYSEDMWRAVMG